MFGFGGLWLDGLPAKETRIGNLQKDESLFLYSLLKVLRPKTVVEFGFLDGHSASVMLSALDDDAVLHSYDVSDYAKEAAADFSKRRSNFFFHFKSQDAVEPSDLNGRSIEFVLFDASHDLTINIATFEKIKPLLAREAVLMVHDTGLWQKDFMQSMHVESLQHTTHKWLDEKRLAHQVDERRFINWITENEKEFAVLNFGSSRVLRHGFSLIERKQILEV